KTDTATTTAATTTAATTTEATTTAATTTEATTTEATTTDTTNDCENGITDEANQKCNTSIFNKTTDESLSPIQIKINKINSDDKSCDYTVEDDEVTPFYKEYVKEIQKKIIQYCELEFEALWKETRRTKTPISKATNILSQKISELKKDILSSDTLCTDYNLIKRVLQDVIPPTLLKVVTFEEIFERVPHVYLGSLFAASLASNYYYSQQFLSNLSVFNFFEYIQKLQSECKN
ncbi:glutamate dehydrogenase, putative, partial [Hepatocystis sp. ex Piliocolobus tephrosceles]